MENKNLAIEFANWVSWNYSFTFYLGAPTYIKDGQRSTPDEVWDKYLQEKSDREASRSLPKTKCCANEMGVGREEIELYYRGVGRLQRWEEESFTQKLTENINESIEDPHRRMTGVKRDGAVL